MTITHVLAGLAMLATTVTLGAVVAFLEQVFVRHFDPKNRTITWPRAIAVEVVVAVCVIAVTFPLRFVPSHLVGGLLALLAVFAPVAARIASIRFFFRTDWATAVGSALLPGITIFAIVLALGGAITGAMEQPVLAAALALVAVVAWLANHRHDRATRHALGAA